ncbi:MAG: hypothetical protein DWQ05_17130 [Calditrichaeota bacterium]|nr:MAG: hypothetical protein DWQ05_17130 [Calditrichota bacterium]
MKIFGVKHIILIAILPLFGFLAGCEKPVSDGKEITLRLTPGPGNPRNSEGDFITLYDGRILFIYTHFTGGEGDNDHAYLAGRYSSDAGQTWSEKDSLIVANEGDMNIMSVSLLRLQNGKIALFYLRKNSEEECIPYMRISDDETHTWSAPKRCITTRGYFVVNNDRVVQLANGRLIIPAAMHASPEYERSAIAQIMCYFSDDNGATWAKSEMAANPEKIVLQEPGIVELKDSRLLLFCRTGSGVQYLSFSEDSGQSWSAVEPSTIRSPLSPASIERIPETGDLLLIWNNTLEPEGGIRTPFNLAISKNEGRTWERTKNIESDADGWYCYTAIEFVDKHVLLGHCAGDRSKYNGLETTQITRLSLDWIYSDATPAPFVISNKNGHVELGCDDKSAEIRYTLNGRMPSEKSALYREPIIVPRTMPLHMQAFANDSKPSQIIFAEIGRDVLQDAQKLTGKPDPGLKYFYFSDSIRQVAGMRSLTPKKSGITPEFSLQKRTSDTNFAFYFEGLIAIKTQGIYTFSVLSNDGSVFYLNDHELINNDGPHGELEKSASIALKTGFHKIGIKYFQMGGGHKLRAAWQGPGFEKTDIPADVLFHLEK